MPKRWSKLQKEIEELLDPKLGMRIQCRRYRMDSQYGSTDLPRYWITLNGKVLFDYPKQFLGTDSPSYSVREGERKYLSLKEAYPYSNDIRTLSEVIREYIDTPKDALLQKEFEKDKWGLTDILKAADRRLGKKRLIEYYADNNNLAVKEILASRFAAKLSEE